MKTGIIHLKGLVRLLPAAFLVFGSVPAGAGGSLPPFYLDNNRSNSRTLFQSQALDVLLTHFGRSPGRNAADREYWLEAVRAGGGTEHLKKVLDWLKFFREHNLNDVVLIGGAPRDLLLGQEPRDFDFTFLVRISNKRKVLTINPKKWNKIMGKRVAPRLQAVADALQISVDDFLSKEFSPLGIDLDYAGPYMKITPDGRKQYSSLGILHAVDDGKNYRTIPFYSVNTLGILPDGHWIGNPEGFEDLKHRQIRMVPGVKTLAADKVLRLAYLSLRLGLTFAKPLQKTLDRFVEMARKEPKKVAADLESYNNSMQKKLDFLFRKGLGAGLIVETLEKVGLKVPLLRMEGLGSDHLRAAAA